MASLPPEDLVAELTGRSRLAVTDEVTFHEPAPEQAIRECEAALGRVLPDELVGLLSADRPLIRTSISGARPPIGCGQRR